MTARTIGSSVVARTPDDTYILNYCARHLARDRAIRRHDFGQYVAGDPRSAVLEAWRFPIVDGDFDSTAFSAATLADARRDVVRDAYQHNLVTFVYEDNAENPARSVSVYGTFAPLYESVALRRVTDTPWWTASVRVEKGAVHLYRYRIDAVDHVDPLNPQLVTNGGSAWSRFFTHECFVPLVFEAREREVLTKLIEHVLPFRGRESELFLDRQVRSRSEELRERGLYDRSEPLRLAVEVGVVNFIDKLLAREEAHHLVDYRLCLRQIQRVLRERFPRVRPADIPQPEYVELYEAVSKCTGPLSATPKLSGWRFDEYQNPSNFLGLLRRHAITGAFAHPRYGGNVSAMGWRYLEELVVGAEGQSHFNWRRSIEWPLGDNEAYRG